MSCVDSALKQYGEVIDTILRVDLITEHFEVIKANNNSVFYNCQKTKDERISQWYLDNLFLPGRDYIHPNDAEGFLCFVNIYSNYNSFTETGITRSTYFYRCLNEKNNYIWKRLEVIPTEDFSVESPSVYAYITSASAIIARALSLKKSQEKYLVNHYSNFKEEIERVFDYSSGWQGSIGAIAFESEYPEDDMNLVVKKYFAPIYGKDNCYIKDNVAYVITEAQTQLEFYRLLLIVHKRLKSDEKPYRISHYWTDDECLGSEIFLERFNNKLQHPI